VLCLPVDVRFIPIATEALRGSEMPQWDLQRCALKPASTLAANITTGPRKMR
jgi:hypothetical protein